MIRPLHEFVALKLIRPDMTKGGVVIPIGAEQPPKGEVVAVGPKVEGIAVGDTVVFGNNANGWFVNDGAEKLLLFRALDLVAVIVEAPEDEAAFPNDVDKAHLGGDEFADAVQS